MLVEKFLNSVILSHTRDEESWRMLRLSKLLGYLAGTLSPFDLECIKQLHDHKGDLEVTLEKNKVTILSQMHSSYEEYLMQKIRNGWESLNECHVVFIFE